MRAALLYLDGITRRFELAHHRTVIGRCPCDLETTTSIGPERDWPRAIRHAERDGTGFVVIADNGIIARRHFEIERRDFDLGPRFFLHPLDGGDTDVNGVRAGLSPDGTLLKDGDSILGGLFEFRVE